MAVEFKDYSFAVKAALDDTTIAWLHEWSSEIASHAKRNCSTGEDYSSQLRGSYDNVVNEGKGEARIGSPMEQAYWEEWGTGEYAAHGDGRKGWWVYKDGYKGNGGKQLTEAEAKAIAARSPSLHATNGRKPNYTLEKAFTVNRPKAEADLAKKLKARMGK